MSSLASQIQAVLEKLNETPYSVGQIISAQTGESANAIKQRWQRWQKMDGLKTLEILERDLEVLGFKLKIMEDVKIKAGFSFWAIDQNEVNYMQGPIASTGGYLFAAEFDFGSRDNFNYLALVSDRLEIEGVQLDAAAVLRKLSAEENRLRELFQSLGSDWLLDEAEEIRCYRLAALGLREAETEIEARREAATSSFVAKFKPAIGAPVTEIEIGGTYYAPYEGNEYLCKMQSVHKSSKRYPDGGYLVLFSPSWGQNNIFGDRGMQKIVPLDSLRYANMPEQEE